MIQDWRTYLPYAGASVTHWKCLPVRMAKFTVSWCVLFPISRFSLFSAIFIQLDVLLCSKLKTLAIAWFLSRFEISLSNTAPEVRAT